MEMLRFEMECRSLSVSDLVPFIGQPNRVYEVLSGIRGAKYLDDSQASLRLGYSA